MPVLLKDEMLSASTVVRSSADGLYALVADVTRIPQWSPETVRAEWVGPTRFKARNRRRLARWQTVADVVTADPGREFSFVVQAMGGDWTQWTYRIDPHPDPGCVQLTETMRMCVKLPWAIVAYEWLFLFVRDRRSDLESNLQRSVDRIRVIVETSESRQGVQ
mgnify:CR=1 FL=1